jgi:hypothetical protein
MSVRLADGAILRPLSFTTSEIGTTSASNAPRGPRY